jgi:hypothetical protein
METPTSQGGDEDQIIMSIKISGITKENRVAKRHKARRRIR